MNTDGRRGAWLRGPVLAALLLACVLVVTRVADLDADPPQPTANGTVWTDEGFWAYPAAWAATHGRWPAIDPPVQRLVPAYAWLERLVFAVCGPGLAQARFISVLAGLGTCVVLALVLRPLGTAWAFFGVVLYGTSPWVVALDRFATPEAVCVLLLGAAFGLFVRHDEPTRVDMVAGVGLIVLAAAAKPVAAFFGAGVVLWWLAGLARRRAFVPRVRLLWPLLLLSALALTLAVFSGWLGQTASYVEQLSRALGDTSAARFSALLRLPWQYAFFGQNAISAGGLLALVCVRSDEAPTATARRAERLCWAWIAAWALCMPLATLSLFRYSYLAWPLVVLGALGYRRCLTPGSDWRSGPRWMWPVFVLLGALWILSLASMALSDLTGLRARYALPLLVAAAACCLVGVRAFRSASARIALVAGVTLVAHLSAIAARAQGRTHLVADGMRQAARLPLAGRSVCGVEAPTLFLAQPAGPIVLSSTIVWNLECALEGHAADYVLVPRLQECTSLGSAYVRTHFAALGSRDAIATFELPSLDATEPLGCEFGLVPLAMAPSGTVSPRP